MLLITVTGFFKEIYNKENKDTWRFFNRTFMIVPEGSGFCISNEQVHISNPTLNQEKYVNCTVLATTATSATATTTTSSSTNNNTTTTTTEPIPGPSSSIPVSSSMSLSEEMKQQMTVTLSQQTNMNFEWSLKCLEEVQWDFENARAAFQEAFSLGKIPPNAFTK